MDIINIYENYNTYFNADLKAIFESCSKIAQKNGHKIYLIGGIVRDMLLNVKSLDIDITVEGDAIEFAHILEKEANAKISSIHKNFGTAKIEINGQKIDLASTRSEIYPKKGHLPLVQEIGCTLKKDVSRRDFTINSLALSLNQNNFADLIDFVGGFNDIWAKKIRVLHEMSFIDDPTRIIRGLKYASRLGFEIEETTLKLQEKYLKNINYDMCYKRIKQEFKKTFDTCDAKTFDAFLKQRIYKLITQNNIKCKKEIDCHNLKHPWIVYFGIVAIEQNLDKFQLTKSEKDIIENAKCLLNKTFKTDFELYRAFCAEKLETLLILAALGREKEVEHYLKNLAKIKCNITGKDLINLGFKPSEKFSKTFDYIIKKKIENPEITKADELKLAKSYLKKLVTIPKVS